MPLKFEHACNDVAVQHFSNYATGTLTSSNPVVPSDPKYATKNEL